VVQKCQLNNKQGDQGPMFDFKNIFAEFFGEKIGVFDSKQSLILHNFIITLVLRKTPIFSPKIVKNRRKL
jgi:hypothetical protein